MRIAIVGSRSVTKNAYPILEAYIPRGVSEIVSGGASGADELAEEYARRHAEKVNNVSSVSKKSPTCHCEERSDVAIQ